MKITKRGIAGVKNEREISFYWNLKWGIKNIFHVNISELPGILETLGVKLPVGIKEYCYHYTIHEAKFVFDSGDNVIFHMGTMVDPYPYIVCNEKEWILTAKDKKVATLKELKKN